MLAVEKRDGALADFRLDKIENAIKKAFVATKKSYSDDIIHLLALRVTSDFRNKVKEDMITVEDIQDSVEKVLEQAGYTDVAKSYILYRKQREKIRNIGKTILDYKDVVNSYVQVEDWRVKENSTVTYSVGGLILNNSGAVTANYWLTEIYDEDIAKAHRSGDIHIHDLSMLTGYSCGWSLRQLLTDGLGGITGKITASPAKHLATLCNQMVNFLGIMQNEWAAAQSFQSFDTYLAPFVKVDQLPYDKVKKCMEAFVFGVNTPSRWGTQAPFSQISLDLKVPEEMREQRAIVGGRQMNFTYGDCQKEMDMINQAFLETMLAGDAGGLGFQYPIPVYSITDEFDWSDSEQNHLLFALAGHYGTPYFANFTASGRDFKAAGIASRGESFPLNSLTKTAGGFFGYGELAGSVGVVTINLPRIAWLSDSEEEFFLRLDKIMDMAARSLEMKREIIGKLLANGLYPYTACYLKDFRNHFSAIGVVGMNEAGLNACWLRTGMESEETRCFAVRMLHHMRERLLEYQKQYGSPFCLEATPAESASYRLAMHDRELYPGIITGGLDGRGLYYTNSTKLPRHFDGTLTQALKFQEEVQSIYTGGTAFHIYMEEEMKDWKTVRDLIRKCLEGSRIPYLTLSPSYSVCQSCGYISGIHEICPVCGKPSDVYGRIAGYYRPVHDWNEGKEEEFKNRKILKLD